MEFTPSSILMWYKKLSSWQKAIAWIALIILIAVSGAWLLLNKTFTMVSTMHDDETTRDAISFIENEYKTKENELTKKIKENEKLKKIEQQKRNKLEKERKHEFEKNQEKHINIDNANDINDVVNVFNKNRSKKT